MTTTTSFKTSEDFRMVLAQHRIKMFVLAGRLEITPTRVGRLLNENEILTPKLAERMQLAVEAILRDREADSQI